MKPKIGIVAAFMHDPDILLLDEPTSGLDPLMQNRFIELVAQEKSKGKTVILSSHIFDEVEKICDRIGMIRNGKLIQEVTVDELRNSQFKTYRVELSDAESALFVKKAYPDAEYKEKQNQMIVSINDSEINRLISVLSKCRVNFLKEEKHTLEEYFMKFYGGNENDWHSLFQAGRKIQCEIPRRVYACVMYFPYCDDQCIYAGGGFRFANSYARNGRIAYFNGKRDIDKLYVKFILCAHGDRFSYGVFHYGRQPDDRRKN